MGPKNPRKIPAKFPAKFPPPQNQKTIADKLLQECQENLLCDPEMRITVNNNVAEVMVLRSCFNHFDFAHVMVVGSIKFG